MNKEDVVKYSKKHNMTHWLINEDTFGKNYYRPYRSLISDLLKQAEVQNKQFYLLEKARNNSDFHCGKLYVIKVDSL